MPRRPPPVRKPPPPVRLTIHHIGAEGDGIGRLPDGTPIYVPQTLPGETIQAVPLRPRGDGWIARATAIETRASDRVAAPCPYFGHCGGCSLQHWAGPAYAAWKRGLLDAALRRAGFAPLPEAIFIPGMPAERRRLDFAVRRHAERIILGLHRPGSAEVEDLSACLVLHPVLCGLLTPLRSVLTGLAAIRRQASLIINLLDAGPDILLRTDGDPGAADRAALAAFAAAHGVPRLSWARGADRPETLCLLRPAVTELSGIAVRPPPGAFLQATRDGEAAIIAAVRAGLPPRLTSRSRVAELYAGCGTLSLALAPTIRVSAFEGDADAVAALKSAANLGGLSGRIETVHRDLARQPLSARELSGFAAVVLDPPHAGAGPQAAQIAASSVPVVIYVSCNPATLSRDATPLRQAGYVLHAATAIDQFLWSSRLESVCVFRKPR